MVQDVGYQPRSQAITTTTSQALCNNSMTNSLPKEDKAPGRNVLDPSRRIRPCLCTAAATGHHAPPRLNMLHSRATNLGTESEEHLSAPSLNGASLWRRFSVSSLSVFDASRSVIHGLASSRPCPAMDSSYKNRSAQSFCWTRYQVRGSIMYSGDLQASPTLQ